MANISIENVFCGNEKGYVQMMESDDDEMETEKLMAQWKKEHDKKVQLTISNVSDCDREITISPKRFHCERSMTYSSESQKTNVSNSPSDTSSIDTSQINSLESFPGTDECLDSESGSTSGKSNAEQSEKVLYARCAIPRRYSFGFSGVRKGFEREYGIMTDMSSTELTTNSEASKYTSNDYDDYEEYSCGGPATDSTPDGRSDPDGISLTLGRLTLKNNTKKSKIPIFVKKAYLKRYINNTINSRKCDRICESDMASNMSESTDDQIQNHIPISADPETDESPEIIVEKFEIEPTSTPIRNFPDTTPVVQQSEEAMSEDDTKKLKNDAPYAINPTLKPTISDIFNEIITINETDNTQTILETSIVGPDKVKNLCEIIDLKAASTKTELDFTPKDLSHIIIQTVSETTTSNRPPEVSSSSTVVKEFDPLPSEEVSAISLDNKTSEDINETTSQSPTNVSPSTGVNNEGASVADWACMTSDKPSFEESKLGVSVDLVALVDSETSVALSMESEGLGPVPPASQPSQEICQTEVKSSEEKQVIEVKEQDDEPPQPTLTQEEWERRENALLLKIIDLEKLKDNASIEGMRMQLKVREEENDLLKHKVRSLESELKAVLNNPDSNRNKELVADIKRQHEELLAKARAMIFDKTKMVRHQESQIEALSGQVFSLKEVVGITKDLLGIRNLEVKNLRDRLDATEAKILTERERQKLLMTRVDTGMKKNEELRNEYTNQLSLFKELRERYEARVDDLRVENKKLADQIGDITKKF